MGNGGEWGFLLMGKVYWLIRIVYGAFFFIDAESIPAE